MCRTCFQACCWDADFSSSANLKNEIEVLLVVANIRASYNSYVVTLSLTFPTDAHCTGFLHLLVLISALIWPLFLSRELQHWHGVMILGKKKKKEKL